MTMGILKFICGVVAAPFVIAFIAPFAVLYGIYNAIFWIACLCGVATKDEWYFG